MSQLHNQNWQTTHFSAITASSEYDFIVIKVAYMSDLEYDLNWVNIGSLLCM